MSATPRPALAEPLPAATRRRALAEPMTAAARRRAPAERLRVATRRRARGFAVGAPSSTTAPAPGSGRDRACADCADAPPARRLTEARGQAAVEVVGFLPLVLAVAFAAFTAIAAFAADEQAGEAAHAGALVLLQGGGDPRTAAKRALPEGARARATVHVAGSRVHVRVRPRIVVPIPGLADRLAGEARADAGPLGP